MCQWSGAVIISYFTMQIYMKIGRTLVPKFLFKNSFLYKNDLNLFCSAVERLRLACLAKLTWGAAEFQVLSKCP